MIGEATGPRKGALAMRGRDPSIGTVRLLVQEGDRDRLRAAVDRALGPADELGESWVIEPLFPDATDPELAATWAVSGAVPAGQAYDPTRVAYDMAAVLARVLDAPVEPDLPSSAYGIEPGEPEILEALGDTRGVHLPGSDAYDWTVEAVRAPDAWRLPPEPGGKAMGEDVLVASIDTGYTDHHEMTDAWSFDLDWDVIDNDDDARDPLRRRWFGLLDSPGHGTHTASAVASRESGAVLGAAPLATVVPIRAVLSVVQVLDSNVARAVHEAHQRGCHVITMSLGGRGFFGLRAAIRAAVADGVIVMAAAGNKVGIVVAPAVYPDCIAVAASNAEDQPWSGSSRGRNEVDIAAPGESVWVASVDSSVRPPQFLERRHHGTSFAVATLAGVAALWLGHHGRDRIIEQVGRPNVQRAFRDLLRGPGKRVPSGWDDRFGAGIVDAAALLAAPLPSPAELTPLELPEEFDPVARLRGVLGDLDRAAVRDTVGQLLNVAPEQVDRLPANAVSELVFRIGEDDELRADLVGIPRELPLSPAADARHLLERSGSRALVESVGEVDVRIGE